MLLLQVSSGDLTSGTLMGNQLQGPQHGRGINSLQDQMSGGNIYAIVTTAKHPGGNIRGQVVLQG